ncbi:serine/threonine-protein kinase [Microlunatus aurantiacus]|uniref:serine/threonine-protein kinase n=1 Tax=Microlunatus aurantiacus TaxID=446786 RepID=UPI0031D16C08
MVTAHPEIKGLSDWRPLARGGFAAVWQARQDSLGRQVAVKVDFRPLDEDKQRRRFLREAGAAGRLSGHPGIVTVHDAGILPDDRPYLVLELCPGGSLSAWLTPEKRPEVARVRDVGVRIADALAAAHARGVIHRDVKPANILIDAYGHAGLTDFGLAAMPEPGSEPSVTMEALTPAYAPPEMFHSHPATEFGDVYSLAATLYALLAGHPPRWPTDGHTPTLPELIELHAEPAATLPHVPQALTDVLAGALAQEASERPTAAQFRDQLAGVDLGPGATVDRRALGLGGAAGTQGVATDPGGSVAQASAAASAESGGGRSASDGPPDGASGGGPSGGVSGDVDPDRETTGERSTRRRDRTLLVAVLVLVVALVGAGALYFGLTGRETGATTPPVGAATPSTGTTGPTADGPSPDGSSASASASGSPSGSPSPPDGFVPCAQLGEGALCPVEPECWAGLQNFGDVPLLATPAECTDTHAYQTFVAVQLPETPRTQSELENDPRIKELCTKDVLNRRLASGRAGVLWDIEAVPYRVFPAPDELSRCVVTTGKERTAPLPFKPV